MGCDSLNGCIDIHSYTYFQYNAGAVATDHNTHSDNMDNWTFVMEIILAPATGSHWHHWCYSLIPTQNNRVVSFCPCVTKFLTAAQRTQS